MEVAVAVRGFAIETVQRTLEVLDGRRPRAQLAGVVTDDVRCQIIALIQHGVVRREDDAARLRRMHVQVRSATGAEFFGSFSRGERVRALAGRIEPRRVRVSALGEVPRRVGTRLLLTEFAVL